MKHTESCRTNGIITISLIVLIWCCGYGRIRYIYLAAAFAAHADPRQGEVHITRTFQSAATRRRPLAGVYSGLVLMALLWGLVFVAIKIGGREMPVEVFNADRFVLGVSLLALVTWRTGRWRRVDWRTALELTALGLVGHGLMQVVFVSGIMRTAASVAALIYGCTPLVVALLSAAFGLERLNRMQWAGLLLAASGMAFVAWWRAGGNAGQQTLAGNALMGVATVVMATYTVWSRRLLARLDLMFVMTWVLGVGAVVIMLWSLPQQTPELYMHLSWAGWLAILYGAILALVVPNLLFLLGVREIGRSGTAAFVNAVPPIGCLAGWLILDETMNGMQALGAVLILAGIYLAQVKRKEKTNE